MHLAATFCMIMQVAKNAFVIFYSGERGKAKILKICDAFSANRYLFPEDVAKQIHAVQEVSTWFIVFADILDLIALWFMLDRLEIEKYVWCLSFRIFQNTIPVVTYAW